MLFPSIFFDGCGIFVCVEVSLSAHVTDKIKCSKLLLMNITVV